jgi:hypothetical protein
MVAERSHAPLKDFVRFEQKDYYSKAGFYYAQGWSFIYFLNDPQTIKKHPHWGTILSTYLRTLIQVYQAELLKLGENRNAETVGKARLTARTQAVDKAFEDVDFEKLETAWKAFVTALPETRRN